MKRLSWVATVVLGLLTVLLTAASWAEEPTQKAETGKPPWQRLLQGEDAKKAAEQEKKLAQLLEDGQFAEALKEAETLADLRAKAQGADHWQTVNASSYVNVIRRVLSAKKAEQQSYSRAIGLQREAEALSAKGHYRDAQPLFEQVLAICRKVLGEEHPYTAASYGNVAVNLNAQGKYKEAEEGYRKALAIFRKALGEEHPDTAASYGNVAYNLNAQSNYKEAEEGFRRALAIRCRVLGEEHPDTAISYNNAAVNLNAQGKYKEAEEGYRKALAIRRKVLGEKHPYTAASYNNSADSLYTQGKYKEADEGYRKALAIHRKVLGDEHPHTARSHYNLASNLDAQGEYKEAEVCYLRAADSFAKARLHIAATGLERATFTSEHSPLLPLAAVLARNGKPDDAWQRFEESLSRGTWDDLSARIRRPQAQRDQQSQITARIDRLNQRIERTNAAKLTKEQSKQREELLSQLRQAYDELAAFTQQLEKQYGPVAGQVFARAQIQAALPADTALLAWIDIAGQPKAADPNGEHWAVLLRSSGDPFWVRLSGSGDKNAWTKDDNQLPARLREALQSPRGLWQPLAERLRKQRLDPLAQHFKGVRRLIVLPSTALAGVPIELIAEGYTVSYAHSATTYVHLLGLPAPAGKGLFALADPVFAPPAERNEPQALPPCGVLLTMVLPGSNADRATPTKLKPNDVLLRYGDTDLAGPADFKPLPESNDPQKRVPVIVWREGKKLSQPVFVRPGKLGVVFAKEPARQALTEQRRLDRLLASRGNDGDWRRLPGTRVEAAALQRLFGEGASRILLDSDASEQRLNELAKSGELGKYRYVHLATHGEFNHVFPLRSAIILSRDHLPDEKQRTELLVSGQPIPDGRLEAEEALQRWNLHCDLVTLSACETALGKYERGEGFVGFAQALILCGTRSVCLSLWKVDDTATALLMERFYQNLLGKREGLDKPMSKAAALMEAKTWLRNLSRQEAVKRAAFLSSGVDRGKGKAVPPLEIVAAAKEDRPFAHPYYWAAFVLAGHAD